MDLDTQELIWSWAVHNMKPWLSSNFEKNACQEEYLLFNNDSIDGYIVNITGGQVEVFDKPSEDFHNYSAIHGRLKFYIDFFRSVVSKWLPSLNTTICLSVADGPVHHPFLPTFSFQKFDEWTQILIPDIDFLTNKFYTDDRYKDNFDYSEKSTSAVFVGATTGGIITSASLEQKALPRINAADYFNGHPHVKFLLPHIVQCENEEVREQVAKLPYCAGHFVPWSEQLQHRFLISMDGNGATCSRVYLALASNSVLLKYDSPYKLYYFDFLTPMEQYIPIKRHQDVELLITEAHQDKFFGAKIASSGRIFADRFLGPEGVEFYMASVLAIYESLFTLPVTISRNYTDGVLFNKLLSRL